MGAVLRTLTVGLAAATAVKIVLAVTAPDEAGRFFGYRLGEPLHVAGLRQIRDETLERQRLQVFQGAQKVDGMPVRASFLVLNGRVASVGLTVRRDDASRLQRSLERRLGPAHAVTAVHGHPYCTWTYGDLSIGYGYNPADDRFAATANLGDLRHFRP